MHTGRHKLVERLTWQLGGDKINALKILKKRGHMDAAGNLTAAGKARDAMTSREREADRGDKPGRSDRRNFK